MKILVLISFINEFEYALIDQKKLETLAEGKISKIGSENSQMIYHKEGLNPFKVRKKFYDYSDGLKEIIKWMMDNKYGVIKSIKEIKKVVHRIVHSRKDIDIMRKIDNHVFQVIEENIKYMPQYSNTNLLLIKAALKIFHGTHIGIFDDAFFNSIPDYNSIYAIPHPIQEKFKIYKTGFHGLYHYENLCSAKDFLKKEQEDLNLLSIYIGRGVTVAAIVNGKIVDLCMGFGNLSSQNILHKTWDIDYEMVFYLLERSNFKLEEIHDIFQNQSGITALIGKKISLQDFLESDMEKWPQAQLALDYFIMQLAKQTTALIANFQKLDLLVISGDIARSYANIRKLFVEKLALLGIKIDEKKNDAGIFESLISSEDSSIPVLLHKNQISITMASMIKKLK